MRERQRAGGSLAEQPSAAPVTNGGDAGTQVAAATKLINEDRLRLAQETLVALLRLRDGTIQATLVIQLVDEQLAHREGFLRDRWVRLRLAIQYAWDETAEWVSASLFRVGDTPVTSLGLLRVVLILTIAWWVSYWLRRALKRLGERREGANQPAFYTVGRLSHYILILIGFLVGLSSIGVDFTNFALVAGAIAIGIGFGLQSIVNNFVSGLILLFERTLKIGDFVELNSGIAGEVREINVRSTVINTNDNIDIVVPNSEFMSGMVTNWTLAEGYCRIHLPFKVAYGTDKELVRQAGLEAAEKLPHTLYGVPGKNPGVWLTSFGDSGLNFELVVWVTPRAVKRPGAVRAAYMWEIESALRKHDIEIPIPQRDLRLRHGFGKQVQDRLEPES
ncbi:MAG: mechanosensitive ion channel [Gammaproteobacteria bacterium]|nr:mechanosensitive ion channel [Gammaproteobacteria bacterium]MCP5425694.1 mechanosensitive ion channel [Gammaproteobacteria bacterium]MCP5459725.1 mechanosensitive ion channel [Gammaproteobacteria bacterium]